MYKINKIVLAITVIILLQTIVSFCLQPFWEKAFAASFMNGSFEIGPTPGSFVGVAEGSTAITGWVVVNNIDYIGTFWKAKDGDRSVDLNGGTIGGIEQAFDTLAGHRYQVTFWLAGNTAGGPTIKTLEVAATDNAVREYTFDITSHSPISMGWIEKTYIFLAHGSTVTLSFTSTSTNPTGPADYYGPALDNVSVADLGPSLKNYVPISIK
jgi:choice-of-anchor C domain-containing protein